MQFLVLLLITSLPFALTTPLHPHPSSPIKCPIIFDGRIPSNLTLPVFDTTTSPYNPKNVKGENLTWSSILRLPYSDSSRFDSTTYGKSNYKAVEVTINDKSLFRAGGKLQTGFRRAGLLYASDTNAAGSDAADSGIVTFHWSVKQDEYRKLNLSHEYMNVWHERADYAGNQFSFVGGVILKQDGGTGIDTKKERESWKVQNRNNSVVFKAKMNFRDWQNFAIRLDYEKSTLQVLYSEGNKPLKTVTAPLPNDNSGGGQLQLGIAKKPTETETVVFDGYQEHIVGSEGQIYGGVFVEDSDGGCVSL